MPFEKWKSVKELKFGGKTLSFCHPVPCDLTWAYNLTYFIILNNQTYYSYSRNREEEITFELWLYGNPKAFSIGGWLKENLTVGAKEDLLVFPSGYKFTVECIRIGTSPAGTIRLYRPDGTYVFSDIGYGVNGLNDINVNDGIVLWVNSEKKEAVIEFMRSVRTQMTDSWAGEIHQPTSISEVWNETQRKELYTVIKGFLPPDFFDDTSTTGGGDGDWYDDSSDTISLPSLTLLNQNSISNTKFITCYKMTPLQLSKLSEELWSDNFFTQISNSVLKPTDFIVNLSLLPVDVDGVLKDIKAGNIYLNGAEGTLINQQFIRVDCGNIELKKKWGGALDYLTKIALYLPFIGEIQLSPDDVMGSKISVIYTVDVMTGSCLASVKIVRDNLDAILYQYNGNCSATYPIVSQDYSTLLSGLLQLGIHTIADYSKSLPQLNKKGTNQWVIDNEKISRNENFASGAASCLFDISPNVQRVGNMSSTVGFMGIKKPFIILSRPIQSLAEDYNTYRGFVSNIAMTLGDCAGYTEVEEIHLENISATENEISEIENLLKTGVIF